MKGPVILGALLAVLVAVPIAMERNRFTPDVWTGAPTTVRAEPSQAARDSEMRSKMLAEARPALLEKVRTYAPINPAL